MNYTEILAQIKNANLFDLYRLSVALQHALEEPAKINCVRRLFKEGDIISYFCASTNCLQTAKVIQKNLKYVSVENLSDQKRWKIPYCSKNLDQINTDIQPKASEKLTRNHLKIGDCVGFAKEGQEIVGVVIRLNHKSVSLLTPDNCRWKVAYGLLFRVIDAELTNLAVKNLHQDLFATPLI